MTQLRARGRWRLALRLGLTLAVVVGLALVVDAGAVVRTLGGANALWLFVMYTSMVTARLIGAKQLALIMERAGYRVGTGRAFLANSLAALYSMILPGDIVAGGAKWANLSAASGAKSLSLQAIVYNRISLLVPPLLAGGIAVVGESPPGLQVSATAIGASVAIVATLTILLYHPGLGGAVERAALWVIRPAPRRISEGLRSAITSLRAFRAFSVFDHASVLGLSSLSTVLSLAMFWFAAEALNLNVPAISVLWIYAAVVMLRQLPVTIGGLGLREGFLVFALSPYGVAAEDAVGLGLLIFTNGLLWALVGAGYQLALNIGLAEWAPAEPEGESAK